MRVALIRQPRSGCESVCVSEAKATRQNPTIQPKTVQRKIRREQARETNLFVSAVREQLAACEIKRALPEGNGNATVLSNGNGCASVLLKGISKGKRAAVRPCFQRETGGNATAPSNIYE